MTEKLTGKICPVCRTGNIVRKAPALVTEGESDEAELSQDDNEFYCGCCGEEFSDLPQ